MKDNIQPCEVIESNLLDPTKETDLKTVDLDIYYTARLDNHEIIIPMSALRRKSF